MSADWPAAAIRLLRLALLALVVTTPFAIEAIYQRMSFSQEYYVKFAGLAIGILSVVTIVVLRLSVPRPTGLFWCYLVYLGVVFITVLARPAVGYGLATAILPLAGACVLFALEAVPADRRWQERAMLLFVGVAFLSAAYGVLQNFGLELIRRVDPETERQVLVSFFGHSNYMASFIGPIVFFAAYFMELRRGPQLMGFAAATIGLTLLCLYWAGTRAASLALVVGAISLVRLRWPRHAFSRKHIVAAVGVAVIALGAATLYGQKWGRHEETLLRRLGSHREIRNRLFFWLVGTEMIREQPILGIGYGRYDVLFWPYAEQFIEEPGHDIYSYILREMRGVNPGEAHNDLLEAVCETGIFGAAAFIGIWVLAFIYCDHTIRRGSPEDARLARYFRAALLFVLVDSQFGFPLQLPSSLVVFWFLLGFIAQTYRRTPDELLEPTADDEEEPGDSLESSEPPGSVAEPSSG